MRLLRKLPGEIVSELLELAESYYKVARDLKRRGEDMLMTAEILAKTGDALCEENMKRVAAEKKE